MGLGAFTLQIENIGRPDISRNLLQKTKRECCFWLATLAAYSRKRNVTVWCPSVRLSRRHTHRDSPGGSTTLKRRTDTLVCMCKCCCGRCRVVPVVSWAAPLRPPAPATRSTARCRTSSWPRRRRTTAVTSRPCSARSGRRLRAASWRRLLHRAEAGRVSAPCPTRRTPPVPTTSTRRGHRLTAAATWSKAGRSCRRALQLVVWRQSTVDRRRRTTKYDGASRRRKYRRCCGTSASIRRQSSQTRDCPLFNLL